jgi:hypothetical protein
MENLMPLLIFVLVTAIAYIAYLYMSAKNNQTYIKFSGGGMMRDVDEDDQKQVSRGEEKATASLKYFPAEIQIAILTRYGLMY